MAAAKAKVIRSDYLGQGCCDLINRVVFKQILDFFGKIDLCLSIINSTFDNDNKKLLFKKFCAFAHYHCNSK